MRCLFSQFMILEAAISSLNRFQDTLWIQFACSYCTITAASWIIFQSCLNRVLLYYIASQASEKKIISWNWMSLERSEIWWVSVWTLHKTLLIIFHVLHGLNKVGSGPEWLAVSWVSASLRAPNTGRHKTHGYYIRTFMWPSLDLISFCIIWKCISKMKYGFFVLYVTPPPKKNKKKILRLGLVYSDVYTFHLLFPLHCCLPTSNIYMSPRLIRAGFPAWLLWMVQTFKCALSLFPWGSVAWVTLISQPLSFKFSTLCKMCLIRKSKAVRSSGRGVTETTMCITAWTANFWLIHWTLVIVGLAGHHYSFMSRASG